MRSASIVVACLLVGLPCANADENVEATAPWSLASTYTGEGWQIEDDSSIHYLDNLDLTALIDGEQLLGLRGVQLFAYGLYNNGHALNDAGAGTLQGVSNIEAPRAWRLYEVWAQWTFAPSASLRVGLYDLNSEFDAIDTAGLFINPSHGIGPDLAQTGENGPSIFPVTSAALRLSVESDRWQGRLAVLDAVAGDPDHPTRTTVQWDETEGVLVIGEIDYVLSNGARTGFGYWQYSEPFAELERVDADGEPSMNASNRGTYLFAESGPLALADARGEIAAFTRTGWANDDVNTVSRYVGAGLTWSGFLNEGEGEIGFAIARAAVGKPWRNSMHSEGVRTSSAETILELTGRFAIGDYVVVQPDVQYVQHPGALAQRDSIWVFGLRLECGFTYEP